MLTDGAASETAILTTTNNMSKVAGSTNFFHYSGHGDSQELGGSNGIIPANSLSARITQIELQNNLGTTFNQYTAFIDACGSGIFPRDMVKGVISSACAANELSYESSSIQHGFFSYYLISGLTQSVISTAEQLHNYASPLTTQAKPSQHPQLKDNFIGELNIYSSAFTLSGNLSKSETWSGNISLQGNITVPSGVSLTLAQGLNLTLGKYGIILSGGSVVLQSGVNIQCAYLKQSSTLKGYFGTIQSAINYSSSGQTIELQPRTYNESCSFTNKSNRKLYGISTSSSTVNGLVSVTNSSYIEIANIKMNNLISINNSYNTNVNSSVFQSSTCINDYYGTSSDFGFSDAFLGGASFAFQSYGGTGDNYYNDISLFDCANYLTNNASYNIGTNNMFCENLSDIVADNGAYAYAISNDYSTPVPTSIYGNVFITGINGVCGSLKPVGKSSVFDIGNFYEDELLKKTDDKYLELLRLTRETKEDANLTQENYKSLFINLIEEYKSIFENAIDPKTSIFALRKISHLYNTLGEKEAFYSYINELLKNDKYSSIKNDIERFNIWHLVEKEDYKGALAIIHNLTQIPKESDTLVCELKYEEGLIYKY